MQSQFFRKIYYYILCGLLGGTISALGYQIMTQAYFAHELMTRPARENILPLALIGALIGGGLSLFPNFLEGRSRSSFGVALQDGLKGMALGVVFGTFAFPLAELAHVRLKEYFNSPIEDMFGRVIAMSILGGLIGSAIGLGLSITSGAKGRHAVLGGLTGGAVSGLAVEAILAALKKYEMLSDNNIQLTGILTLLIIGVVILMFISLFVISLSNAYLVGQKGSKFNNQVFPLSKFKHPNTAIIGSDPKAFIRIADSERQHASVCMTKRDAILKNLTTTGQTFVDGNSVRGEFHLNGDEIISIGSVSFQYVKNSLLTATGKGSFSKQKIRILN